MANCTMVQQRMWRCGRWQWTAQSAWIVLNTALMLFYALVLCALHAGRKEAPLDSSFFRLWWHSGGLW